jgi:amidohydrolase family protein
MPVTGLSKPLRAACWIRLAWTIILFETDFPHPTSLYGDEVHARIKAGLADCEESAPRKILWGNAEKLYKVTAPSATDEAALSTRSA